MADVRVTGDYSDVQSSIDLYLSITSKSSIEEPSKMRDIFFKMFKEEDEQREDGLVSYEKEENISELKIRYIEQLNLMGNERVYDPNESYFKSVSQEGGIESDTVDSTSSFLNSLGDIKNQESDSVEESFNDSLNIDNFLDNMYMESPIGGEEEEDVQEDQWSNWGSDTLEDDFTQQNKEDLNKELGETFVESNNFEDNEDFLSNNLYTKEVTKSSINDIKKVVEAKESILNVTTDLRDFIKANPGCEVSDALKYFSKKEIDRQLSRGRVFKRKNKLLI